MEPTPLTRPPLELDRRRVRVALDGLAHWGRLEGAEIVLDTGAVVSQADAHYLAPVDPSKVIAVHLTYRSRVEEYRARIPRFPSYFMKPPSALNGHPCSRWARRRS